MNISEAEKATGLKRANIRFYEKCGLFYPFPETTQIIIANILTAIYKNY